MALKHLEKDTEIIFPCYGEIKRGKIITITKMNSETVYDVIFSDELDNTVRNGYTRVRWFWAVPLDFIKENNVDFIELFMFCKLYEFYSQVRTSNFENFISSLARLCTGGKGEIKITSSQKEIEIMKDIYKKVCKTILIFKDWILESSKFYFRNEPLEQFINDLNKFLETTQYLK